MYADSVTFDPYFPVSQQQSFDFGYTPASSAESSQYPFSLDLSSSALLDSAPCTPSRCSSHGNQNFFGQQNPLIQFTPPNSNEFMSFHDPFMQQPQFDNSPVGSVYGTNHGLEDTSMWPMLDSSPMHFSEQRGRPSSRLSIMTGSSSSRHGRTSPFESGLISPRQSIDLAQVHQKSAALQRLQRATTRPQPAPRAKALREQPVEAPRKTQQRVVRKTKHWCTMGCKERGFSRKEHLTRHINE